LHIYTIILHNSRHCFRLFRGY